MAAEVQLKVTPTSILGLKVGWEQKVSIQTTEVEYSIKFNPTNVASFLKETETIIGLEAGSCVATVTAGDKTVEINIEVQEALAPENVTRTLSTIENQFKPVRYIEDGKDLVSAENTNRPHKDILQTVINVADIQDAYKGQMLGAWNNNEVYRTGDIVSFLSQFYRSLKDNNKGNAPRLRTGVTEDEYWVAIDNVAKTKIKDFIAPRRLVTDTATSLINSVTNGKDVKTFSIKANTRYILVRQSERMPLDESLHLYLDYTEKATTEQLKDGKFPQIAYVEMNVKYLGFKYNSSNSLVPEVNFEACHSSSYSRGVSIPYSDYTGNNSYDEFGAYGIQVQSSYRGDGTVTISFIVKWDCKLTIEGSQNIQPFIDKELTVGTAKDIFKVNHLVRPYGGDRAFHSIGELKTFEYSMNAKQMWDAGLIYRKNPFRVKSSVYGLLALKLGMMINYGDSVFLGDYPNEHYKNPTTGETETELELPAIPNNTFLMVSSDGRPMVKTERGVEIPSVSENTPVANSYSVLYLYQAF